MARIDHQRDGDIFDAYFSGSEQDEEVIEFVWNQYGSAHLPGALEALELFAAHRAIYGEVSLEMEFEGDDVRVRRQR
jgi:hypothetical protein